LGSKLQARAFFPKYTPFSCSEVTFEPLKMLLHSLPRATRNSTSSSRSCSRQLSSSIRSYQSTAYRLAPSFSAAHQAPITSQSQSRSAHAISNPTLAGIEKRWEAMPPQEQAELWMQLRDRMKVDWHEMTLQEKKAGMCLVHREEAPRHPNCVHYGCHDDCG
jgi:cytochrome c oxidase subunit 4